MVPINFQYKKSKNYTKIKKGGFKIKRLLYSLLSTIIYLIVFYPILNQKTLFLSNFNFIFSNTSFFTKFKVLSIILHFSSNLIIFYYIDKLLYKSKQAPSNTLYTGLNLLIGKNSENAFLSLPESSLYQNILITGAIGTGKTASAMYPFTRQLINYKADTNQKLGMLILDVKGNYYEKVSEFSKISGREDDLIVIELGGKYKYNPLNKPQLKASILANRLKEILLLFSPNNSESYWLDIAEHILEAAIIFCRIYNYNYVTFEEIHKLISNKNYYYEQQNKIKKIFLDGKLSKEEIYNLSRAISYIENEFFSLDDRTFNILKSDITRMTNSFVSDFQVKQTFCPTIQEENFYGFKHAINSGKIVVLNMNISEYKNISKIIAAYLKLDFQTEILSQLANSNKPKRTMVFISDEYQEYVTISDANFYAQSRESKCINIVSTQSYTSLLNSLNNQNAVKVIIQNLVNKIWFRTDDIFTIEEAQKQIGKEDKQKISKTISENSKSNQYNFIDKDYSFQNSTLSESVNSYTQFDYIYDYKFFTQELPTFSALTFLSDGQKILSPQKLELLPYFKYI